MLDALTAAEAVHTFKNELAATVKGIKDEALNAFAIGLSDYINDRQKKFSKINTFLSREQKVDFYKVFYQLSLSHRDNTYNSQSLYSNLFKISNTAGIIGIAGSGKTMLMRHIFLSCKNELSKIPIYIELRDLNNYNVSLELYISDILLKNKIKPNTNILDRALRSGKFIFLFDGFDELNFDKKELFTVEAEKFIDVYPSNFYIFSSRPGTSIESFPRLETFVVNPLTQEQIKSFIKIQLADSEDNTLATSIISTIEKESNADYLAYISNPLLLSMFILTYRNYPQLPRRKSKFYWNVYDTLCSRHDSLKKGGYYHQKKTELEDSDFENILKRLSIKSILESKFNFDRQYLHETLSTIVNSLKLECNIDDLIYDVSVSISIIIQDGLDYKFPHRTIQDYFAVLFIRDQNDAAKQKIYSDKISSVLLRDVSSNQNFFDLCYEIDKDSFTELFLLPIIQEFTNKFPKKVSPPVFASFLQEIELSFDFLYFTPENVVGGVAISFSKKYISLIAFFGVDIYEYFEVPDEMLDMTSAAYRFIEPKLTVGAPYEINDFATRTDKLEFKKLDASEIILLHEEYKAIAPLDSIFDFFHQKNESLVTELKEKKDGNLPFWDF